MVTRFLGGRARRQRLAQIIVARMHQFYDAFNRSDSGAMAAFISSEYVEHFGAPTLAGIHLSSEEFQQRRRQGREALDDLFIEVVQIMAATDTVRPTLTAHVIIHGRQRLPYGMLPLPENPQDDLALEAISILVFDERGEQLVEHWETQNIAGVLQRRGIHITNETTGTNLTQAHSAAGGGHDE